MSPRRSRRDLLAATSAGLAAGLAGCGYRPAGGEHAWERDVRGGVSWPTEDGPRWLADDDRLYRLRNRDGRRFRDGDWVDVRDAHVTAYDARGEVAWSGATPEPIEGPAVAANGTVVCRREDGRLAGLSGDDLTSDGRETDATAWTVAGPADRIPSHFEAGGDVVVLADDERLVGVDLASGDERFARERTSIGLRTIASIGVGTDRVWVVGDGAVAVLDRDGSVLATRSISEAPDRLVPTAEGACFRTGKELVTLDAAGERVGTVTVDGIGPATVVPADNRYYHYGGGVLTAVDVTSGERAWTSNEHRFRTQLVADENGVYGRVSDDESDCAFAAVTADGESWWRAPAHAVGCAGDLRALGDRLVVRDDDRLYGFRTSPGNRWTVL